MKAHTVLDDFTYHLLTGSLQNENEFNCPLQQTACDLVIFKSNFLTLGIGPTLSFCKVSHELAYIQHHALYHTREQESLLAYSTVHMHHYLKKSQVSFYFISIQ